MSNILILTVLGRSLTKGDRNHFTSQSIETATVITTIHSTANVSHHLIRNLSQDIECYCSSKEPYNICYLSFVGHLESSECTIPCNGAVDESLCMLDVLLKLPTTRNLDIRVLLNNTSYRAPDSPQWRFDEAEATARQFIEKRKCSVYIAVRQSSCGFVESLKRVLEKNHDGMIHVFLPEDEALTASLLVDDDAASKASWSFGQQTALFVSSQGTATPKVRLPESKLTDEVKRQHHSQRGVTSSLSASSSVGYVSGSETAALAQRQHNSQGVASWSSASSSVGLTSAASVDDHIEVVDLRPQKTKPHTMLPADYWCEKCCVVISGESNWVIHVNGQGHKSVRTTFRCNLCDTTIYGEDNLQQHLEGQKHKKRKNYVCPSA